MPPFWRESVSALNPAWNSPRSNAVPRISDCGSAHCAAFPIWGRSACSRVTSRPSATRSARSPKGDRGYSHERVTQTTSIKAEIVSKITGLSGFAVPPRRWVVARVFAWINRNRRLTKDVEAPLKSAAAMLMIRRSARSARVYDLDSQCEKPCKQTGRWPMKAVRVRTNHER